MVALGLPLAGALVLAAVRPANASWALTLALALAFAVVLLVARRAGRTGARLALAASVFAFLALWPEVGLRLAGYSSGDDDVGGVAFGTGDEQIFLPWESDPDLFWHLPTHVPDVNSWGFPGDEIRPKPAGFRRVAFFGDSCMQQGYPDTVEEVLQEAEPDVDVVNLSVSGYTTFQGRRVIARHGAEVAPDLGVVGYGWNDHWSARGMTDTQRAAASGASFARGSRLLQWLAERLKPEPAAAPKGAPRVSLEEYRTNLEAIGEALEELDCRVLLLTPPSAHGIRGVPDKLIERGYAASKADAVRLHRRYNEVVREVAGARGWQLIDLEREIDERRDLERIFGQDGIHFTTEGQVWVARRVAKEIRDRDLLADDPGGN